MEDSKVCLKCNGTLVRCGYLITKRKPIKRQRFRCKKCNLSVSFPRERLKPRFLKDAITKLMQMDKGYIRKYDCMKLHSYSSREITRILETKYKIKTNKSTVAQYMKNIREEK